MEESREPARPLLRIERSDHAGETRLELIGELDLSTIDALKLRLELAEREDPGVLIVDLARVTFMDSMGLGVLLSHKLRADKAGRRFLLLEGPEHVQQVFTATGVHGHFEWGP